jgi:sodium-dependent dicarboxylate transporter 2/3/5
MGQNQVHVNDKKIRTRKIALVVAPLISLCVLLFANLDPQHPEVTRTAAVALLMAIWWITEAIPLAATALLPIVLFPCLGIMKGSVVAPLYFNYIIFLFLGGFVVALAMQRWNLHRRIALKIILLIGAGPRRIILGFMIATAFLSMWISNTATTMMMVPIALAVILKLEESFGPKEIAKFSVGLLLGIAYAASIGGIATLIGTPPNLSFARILTICFPQAPEISFAGWFGFAFPLSALFLVITWRLLTLMFCPPRGEVAADLRTFQEEYAKLGPMAFEERVVLADFLVMALLWLSRNDITIGGLVIPGWATLLRISEYVDDGTVAIIMALILFLIPSRRSPKGMIMDWPTAEKLPWGIVLLFGGGFALASGFRESGLSAWLGGQLKGLAVLPPIMIVIAICTMMTFLTELTSNTATTEMILPIIASVSVAVKLNPLLLMIPATLSASCAFMLPVATPPNAIIFGTKRLEAADMARAGILLNFVGVCLITLAVYFLTTVVLHIDVAQFPQWAAK